MEEHPVLDISMFGGAKQKLDFSILMRESWIRDHSLVISLVILTNQKGIDFTFLRATLEFKKHIMHSSWKIKMYQICQKRISFLKR